MRATAINESMVYLSYHNIDIAYAFRLAALLIRYYRDIWLDRFEIAPDADWEAGISAARERAAGAIVIVSDEYLRSGYCRAEFAYFRGRDISVTAVIPREFSTELIADLTFSDWIDLRRWFDDPDDQSVENLLSQVPEANNGRPTGERLDYLRGFIQGLELELAMMPTAWLSLGNHAALAAEGMRPRMAQPQFLHELEMTTFKTGAAETTRDFAQWSADEPQFVLSGEPASGKTFLARMLALKQAHAAMHDAAVALPIWLDLAHWDGGHQTLDAFMESQWSLVSYWQHWLEHNNAYFILDNWEVLRARQPAGARELSDWIDGSPRHRFVVVSASTAVAGLKLPRAQIGPMTLPLAQKMAAAHLNLEQQNSFRQLLRQKAALIENNALDTLALGLELLAADRALAFTQWQQDPAPALIAKRLGQRRDAARGLKPAYVTEALRGLAWAMMQHEDYRYVNRADAESQANDPRIIECALDIGILREGGGKLRFENAAVQRYLALDGLKRDGLVKYLTRPEFTAEQGRTPRKWDAMALTLVDALAEDRRLPLVEQIADIDPFLGVDCARRHPELYADLRESLITKLVGLCAQNPSARSDFRGVVGALPQPNATAESLVAQLSGLNNAAQLWLWREVAALPLELPIAFAQLVAEIKRDPATPAREQLADYSMALSLAWLVKLAAQPEASLRRNAIWLLGELRYLPSAILLLDFLEADERSEADIVLSALMKFAYSEILARVLRWSQRNPAHQPALITALAERKRHVTSRLLALAAGKQITLDAAFFQLVVDADETDIAIGLAQIAAQSVDLPAAVARAVQQRADAETWRQRLAGAVKRWPNREAFARLLDDVKRVLREPPQATVAAGSKLEALLYGQPLFDSPRAQAEGGASDGLPGDLRQQLESDDWRRRHQALNRLMDFPADSALPLLIDFAGDDDQRVRLAAYEALARFEGEPSAEAALVAALSDPDDEIAQAALGLLKSATLRSLDSLIGLLDSKSARTVAAAIEVLKGRGQPEAETALRSLLGDDRVASAGGPSIGQQARAALVALGVEMADAERGPAAPTDRPDSAQFSDEDKILRALAVIRDDDWGRTQKAAKFLRRFARHLRGRENPQVLRLLSDALQDANWSVRWAGAEALAALGDRQAIPRLTQAVGDPSWIVQVAVVRGLAQLGARSAVSQLLPLLDSGAKAVREAAAEACGALQAAQAVAALGELVKQDADEFVRFAALRALVRVDAAAARPWLELALSDGYLHLRLYAMQQLAPAMDASHLPLLRQLLDDGETPSWEGDSIRDLAIKTLSRINHAEARALLKTVRVDEERTGA